MQLLLRTSAFIFIIGLLAGGVFSIRYACAPREMLTTIRRTEELELLRQAALRCLEGKHQATQGWMMQRRTWEETMQRFQELDQEKEEAWPGYARIRGEITTLFAEERHYEFIFHYVKTGLSERPEELAVVLRRLEKDSQQLHSGIAESGAASQEARVRRVGEVQEPVGASASPP